MSGLGLICCAWLAYPDSADPAVLFVKQYELKRQVVRVDAKAKSADVETPSPPVVEPIAVVASRSSSHETVKDKLEA